MSKRRSIPAAQPTVGSGDPLSPPGQRANGRQTALTLFVLAAACAVAFGPAMNSPFIFDDLISIRNNPSLHRLWPPVGDAEHPGPFNPPQHFPTDGRPLVNLTLAINYQIGQLQPLGYHLFNLLVHVLSAGLLAAIVRRTLQLEYFGGAFQSTAWPLSLVVALIWAVHPLQSEAVIYVTQRTELLMGFFYLTVLYSSLRCWTSNNARARAAWCGAATIACLAGMACKEVMVTAPIVVLLYERTFLAGSFRRSFERSWRLYLGLAGGWALLLLLQLEGPHSDSAGFHLGPPVYVWWLTQAKVLWTYHKLVVWPAPLVIHYATPYLPTVGEALPWLAPTVALAVATLVLLWRNRPVGFLAACVWLILSPTLVVPIVTEVAAERRMYLPLAAIVAGLVVGGFRLYQAAARYLSADPRRPAKSGWPVGATVAAVAIVALLSLVSWSRATVYRQPLLLWQETADHQPNDPVVRNSLGGLLAVAGRPQDALPHLEAAVRLKPDYAEAQCNLGLTLIRVGRPQDAIPHLQEALRLKPNYPDAHNNLATAYLDSGQPQQAIEHFQTAVRLLPDFSEAYNNLGDALLKTGQRDQALVQFAEALRARPDNFEAHSNLTAALVGAGRLLDAIDHGQQAVSLKPDYAQAHNNLSVALLQAGRADEALKHAREAARLAPNSAEAQFNLGNVLVSRGQPQQAIEPFSQVVRLQPSDAEAQNQLGAALFSAGRPQDAADHWRQAVQIRPQYAEAWANLASASARLNRPAEAVAAAEKAIELARLQGNTALAQQVDAWLASYRGRH